jgi:hypothetical protein
MKKTFDSIKMLTIVVLVGFVAFAGLSGCALTSSAPPATTPAVPPATSTPATPVAPATSTAPTAQQIISYADQWLGAAEGVFNNLCQNAVVGSSDCQTGSTAEEIANLALAAFASNPTVQNQTALTNAMTPVYAAANAANTPAPATAPATAPAVAAPAAK